MNQAATRHDFASDNTASLCPEAWIALERAKLGTAPAYGDDRWSAQLSRRVREIFESDCESFVVFNGTAANALALAQLCEPFNSVICHERAHIQTDECGAPEFFASVKLLSVTGLHGKIDINAADAVLARQPDVHSPKPGVISITQATELGTLYQPQEIRALSELARRNSMFVHMDGARFTNALAGLDCYPKEITWAAGVDVLCFGGTKNGLAMGELIVFFKKELAHDFSYRLKQAGQLGSKTRFLAAPWLALLTDDVWLRNARHANAAARELAAELRKSGKIEIVFPVESNAIFCRIDEPLAKRLYARGWHFYRFLEPDIYRLMCSWATSKDVITDFVKDLEDAVSAD